MKYGKWWDKYIMDIYRTYQTDVGTTGKEQNYVLSRHKDAKGDTKASKRF